MLIPTSALPAFTALHVAISLAAIASGFVVLFGLIAGKRLDRWTAGFLATTVLTSVTGFGFPIRGMTPGIAFGIISLVVLADRGGRQLPICAQYVGAKVEVPAGMRLTLKRADNGKLALSMESERAT